MNDPRSDTHTTTGIIAASVKIVQQH